MSIKNLYTFIFSNNKNINNNDDNNRNKPQGLFMSCYKQSQYKKVYSYNYKRLFSLSFLIDKNNNRSYIGKLQIILQGLLNVE